MLTPECVQLLEELYGEYGNAEAVRKDSDLCLRVFLRELKEHKKRINSILMQIGEPDVFESMVEEILQEEAGEEVPQHMRRGK